MKSTVIIGGGAAGLIACGFASENSDKVYLIEKNKKLGKKLRITGKGRCNITNSADIEDFFGNIPTNPRFLYSALYSFTNEDIVKLLERLGVKTKTERGGRVFPVSDNAHDVADALSRFALKKNVELVCDSAKSLIMDERRVVGAVTAGGKKLFGKVILATGGKSYPVTGSTGDGYKLAQAAGHSIKPLVPSLIPIETKEKLNLSGLSLKNVTLSLYNSKGKEVYSELGEMLFTHFGISGPLVLSASAHMKGFAQKEYFIKLDLKPALSDEKLDARILRDFEDEKNKDIINGLDKLLPKALIPVVIEKSGIDMRKKINAVTRQERRALADTIKGFSLTPTAFRPIDEAIITSGGVNVREINPSTMQSKLAEGLYFAGEIIDVDAYTGGYNLQIAWSTGYLAGVSVYNGESDLNE